MSIWVAYSARIKHPRYDLLRSALERLARRLGGQLELSAKAGAAGRIYPFVVRVKGNVYAVTVGADGDVIVECYDWSGAGEFTSALTEEYARLAVIEAGASNGYSVEERASEGGYVVELRKGDRAIVAEVKGSRVEMDAVNFKGKECEREVGAVSGAAGSLGLSMTATGRAEKPEYLQVGITGGRIVSNTVRVCDLLAGLGLSLDVLFASPCG